MTRLILCPACTRHVHVTEQSCPFCSAALPAELRAAPEPPLPPAGISRARAYAFRAALLAGTAASTLACGSGTEAPPAGDSGTDAASGGSGGTADASTGGAGGAAGSGGAGGTGGGLGGYGGAMPYGCVFPDPEDVAVV